MPRFADDGSFIYRPRFFWAAGFVAAAFLAVFFRLYPLTVHPVLAARSQATLIVYSNIQRQVGSANLKSFLDSEKLKTAAHIDEATNRLLTRMRKEPPYLMEIDPYYYLSLTRRLLDGENVFAERKGRLYRNPRMLAPTGAWYPIDVHPFVGAAAYRAASLVWVDVPLTKILGWVPVWLSVAAIAIFFVAGARTLGLDGWAVFLGALTLTLAPIYLRRSLWGWYDTDSYNILFPLAIAWTLFVFLKHAFSERGRFALAGAIVLSVVYSLFWRGWLLPHLFLCAGYLVGVRTLARIERERPPLWMWLVFPFVPVAAGSLVWGREGLHGLLTEASGMALSFSSRHFSLWPDVFLTVGELHSSNLREAVALLGGGVLVLFAAAGTVLTVLDRDERNAVRAAAAMTVGYLVTGLWLGSKLERFTLLAVVPTALAMAFAVTFVLRQTRRNPRDRAFVARALVVAVIGGLLLSQAHRIARVEHPIYNVSWNKLMTFLREETPKDAIVTTWWSPGHFITGMGEKRVTFDGATQNTPQAYWVANMLLSDSEEKSTAILRMLDTSGVEAVEFLTSRGRKLSEATALLHRILPMGVAEAEKNLPENLNRDESKALLALTHPASLPPGYVFVYNDMVEKAPALEYAGKWNFAKAEAFADRLKTEPKTVPAKLLRRGAREHILLMWSLSEGPYFQQAESFQSSRKGNRVSFANGLTVDLETFEANVTTAEASVRPNAVYLMKDGALERKTVSGTGNVSALLLEDRKGNDVTYRSVLADRHLIESTLFRLYYLKGEGLKRFTLVAEDESFEHRTRLYLYKVNW